MPLTKDDYKPRIIDEKITKNLRIFGAISIEGPKWVWQNMDSAKPC